MVSYIISGVVVILIVLGVRWWTKWSTNEARIDFKVMEKKNKEASPVYVIGMFMSLIANLLIMGAIGIVIWQIYTWAKTGVWVSLCFYDVLVYLKVCVGKDLSSIYNPQNWIGLAKIVQWFLNLPAFLWLLVVGGTTYIIFLGCASIVNKRAGKVIMG
tara:strand:+ start:966 stop:1439 length:474 start_codon:yes stop_codon:yes gene_type:complete